MTSVTISPNKREAISLEVIRILYNGLTERPSNLADNESSPFHEAFLNVLEPKFDTKANEPSFVFSSNLLLHFNTDIWPSFFERVAHILSDGEKREFTQRWQNRLTITLSQRDAVASIMSDLKNSTVIPNKESEDQRLLLSNDSTVDVEAQDFTADNFVETNEYIEAIELKSVRPNAGEMQSEKRKILNAKAALQRRHPGKQISYYFGFPFDPWRQTATGFDKQNFLDNLVEGRKYLDPSEVLLAEELWDKLSGHANTMQELLDIINAIATPDFINVYNFLCNIDNLENNYPEYIEKLELWGLFREKGIVESMDILRKMPKNRDLSRALRARPFNSKGEYNENRYDILKEYLSAG